MSLVWGYTLRDGEVHGEIFNVGEVPAGWKFSPADLDAASAPEAVETDKAALMATARGLGLKVHGRTGEARLRAMIAEAKANDDGE